MILLLSIFVNIFSRLFDKQEVSKKNIYLEYKSVFLKHYECLYCHFWSS